jgi:hypothetical protein
MAIRGLVERCDGEEISGWVFDEDHPEPVLVSVVVDDLELCRLRADAPRADQERAHGRLAVGFGMRLHPGLAALLPHGATLSARVGEAPLPRRAGVTGGIDNPACASLDGLRARLAEGWLVSPKSGNVFQPLAALGARKGRLLDALAACEERLRAWTGHELLIAYGTLLGAAREGDLIGHDDDVDAIFYVPTQTTREAAAAFAEVVRALAGRGQRLNVVRSGQFHWHVFPGVSVDVFTGWFHEGALYSYCAGGMALGPGDVAPVPWDFLGRRVQVPREHERVLEMTYGPGWRVPDPAFQWRLGAAVREQMDALEREWKALG